MSFSAKWVNLDETVAKYGRLEAELPDELKRLMTKSIIYAQGEIPAYPAANSDYRRTGSLGRVVTAFPGHHGGRSLGGGGGDNGGQPLTRVESMGGGVRGVIGGRLEYIDYVVGYQAYMHKGRWWQLKKVIMGARGGIEKIFRAGVMDLFK
jgi:hypothetical protein